MKVTELLTESKSKYWGYHLLLDCRGLNDNCTSKPKIKAFTKELVKRIKMEAVGEPVIKYLLPDDPKSGYSMMQLIQTSNITAHFMDKDRTAYFDIFSCKDFDPKTAEAVVKEYFEPTKIKSKFLTRQA